MGLVVAPLLVLVPGPPVMSLTLFGGDLGHRADGRFHPIRRCLGILGRHPPVQEHVGDTVPFQMSLGVVVNGLDEMVQDGLVTLEDVQVIKYREDPVAPPV